MRITVFTSNQPRHVALIEALARVATHVYAVQECNTVFPGRVEDFFRRSEVMQRYFGRVIAAERRIFGSPRFTGTGGGTIRQLPIRMGDLSLMPLDALGPALEADLFVVFGASYIRGPLCEFLLARRAINIHMGVSPFYRGSSCNFWALYDRR
ncbi:MAG: methionyl-tRNA formyltransferase, partial [Planctomycetes bacterium]|nr:methionyl-tRNA formyltransferase [Planctomycetota bacterium]